MKKPKVIFFDVNETLLDLQAMNTSVAKALNGRDDLLPLWFTTMLQYSLVATVGENYEDFGVIGAAALHMVAANNGIELSKEQALESIRIPITQLPPHPDIRSGLERLKGQGYTLVSFTNSSNKAVKAQFEYAELLDFFEERLSVEDIQKFKPHKDTYVWAQNTMDLKPEECMLIAAHGWDIAGASWAGWQTGFIQRKGAQLYPLAPMPTYSGMLLTDIVEKLNNL